MNSFKSIFKKDLLIGLRMGKMYISISIFLPFSLIIIPIYIKGKSLENINYIEFISSLLINYAPFIILYIMLFVGNSVIQKIITREKINRTTIPLICSGITPKKYWQSKILAVFVLTSIISSIILFLIISTTLILTPELVSSFLPKLLPRIIIAPLFSMVFIGLTTLLYMVSLKFWIFSMIGMIIPVFILPYWNSLSLLNNKLYSLGIGIVCVLLLSLMSNLANLISRERFSGIFETI